MNILKRTVASFLTICIVLSILPTMLFSFAFAEAEPYCFSVVDESSQPISGAVISLFEVDADETSIELTTDKDGKAETELDRDKEYEYIATHAKYFDSDRTPIDFINNESETEIVLNSAKIISGTVSADSTGIDGINISIYKTEIGDNAYASTTTSDSGKYSVKVEANNMYIIVIVSNEYKKEVQRISVADEDVSKNFMLEEKTELELEFDDTSVEVYYGSAVSIQYPNLPEGVEQGKLRYESSDTDIIEPVQNGESWTLTIKAASDKAVRITCYREADDEYKDASGSYQITVKRGILILPDNKERLDDVNVAFEYGNDLLNYEIQAPKVCDSNNNEINDCSYTYSYKKNEEGSISKQAIDGVLTLTEAGIYEITITVTADNYNYTGIFTYMLNVSKYEANAEFTVSNPSDVLWTEEYQNMLIVTGLEDVSVTYSAETDNNDADVSVSEDGTVTVDRACTVTVTAVIASTNTREAFAKSYTINFVTFKQNVAFENTMLEESFTNDDSLEFANKVIGLDEGNTFEYYVTKADNTVPDIKDITVDHEGKVTVNAAGEYIVYLKITEVEDKYEETIISYTIRAIGGNPLEGKMSEFSLCSLGSISIDELLKQNSSDLTLHYSFYIDNLAIKENFIHYNPETKTIVLDYVPENVSVVTLRVSSEKIKKFNSDTKEFSINIAPAAQTVGKVSLGKIEETDNRKVTIEYVPGEVYPIRIEGLQGNPELKYSVSDSDHECVGFSDGKALIKKYGQEVTVKVEVQPVKNSNGGIIYAGSSFDLVLNLIKAEQKAKFKNDGTELTHYTYILGTANKINPELVFTEGFESSDESITWSANSESEVTIAEVNGSGEVSFVDRTAGNVTIQAVRKGDDFFTDFTIEYSITTRFADERSDFKLDKAYNLSGEKDDPKNEWYKGDVTVIPMYGYNISFFNSDNIDNWQERITENRSGSFVYKYSLKCVDQESDLYGAYTTYDKTVSFSIDKENPEIKFGIQRTDSGNFWMQMLESITFGGISIAKEVSIEVIPKDEYSGCKSVWYYIEDIPKDKIGEGYKLLTIEQLDGIAFKEIKKGADGSYIQHIGKENRRMAIYVKTVDIAGNVSYASSEGIVMDTKAPTFLYNDVSCADSILAPIVIQKGTETFDFDFSYIDEEPYSGISEVKYFVYNTWTGEITDGTYFENDIIKLDKTEIEGNLLFDGRDLYTNSTGDEKLTVSVKSDKENETDELLLVIKCVDKSGNECVNVQPFAVDLTTANIRGTFPIEMTYYDENASNDEYSDFTIEIVESPKGWNADNAEIKIKAKGTPAYYDGIRVCDDDGYLTNDILKEMTNSTDLSEAWVESDAESSYNKKHTLHLDLGLFDGEFEMEVNYRDRAGNESETYRSKFCVDRSAPNGELVIGENTWQSVFDTVTFGIFNMSETAISFSANEDTSGIKSAQYAVFKDQEVEYLTAGLADGKKLDDIVSGWMNIDISGTGEFNGILDSINSDSVFVYIIRLEDAAGHVTFVSTNPAIVDTRPTEIKFGDSELNDYVFNQIYNRDIKVQYDLTDKFTDIYSRSGINKIEYWVLSRNDENDNPVVTQSGLLSPDIGKTNDMLDSYINSVLSGDFVIDSELNNNDFVQAFIMVTDNAGNISVLDNSGNTRQPVRDQNGNLIKYTTGENYGYKLVELADEEYISIDISAPALKISENQTNNSYINAESKYSIAHYNEDNFKFDIEITERNTHFKPENAVVTIEKLEKGSYRQVESLNNLDFRTELDDADHNNDKSIATLPIDEDGQYRITFTFVDSANHIADKIEKEFALDRVAPQIKAVSNAGSEEKTSVWETMVNSISFTNQNMSNTSLEVECQPSSTLYETNGNSIFDSVSETEIAYAVIKVSEPGTQFSVSLDVLNGLEYTVLEGNYKVPVIEDDSLEVIFRATDAANNTSYISTDGIILDKTSPDIVFGTENNENDIVFKENYNADYEEGINVLVKAGDILNNNSMSGLESVEYWVYSKPEIDSKEYIETQHDRLYPQTEIQTYNSTLSELLLINNQDLSFTIENDVLNYSNDLMVKIKVTDRAGNSFEKESGLINYDIISPSVTVSEDWGSYTSKLEYYHNKEQLGDQNYKLEFDICERDANFDAAKITLDIHGVNSSGKEVVSEKIRGSNAIINWQLDDKDKQYVDEAVHKFSYVFDKDANYSVRISGEDSVGNAFSYEYSFVIDRASAEGEIKLAYGDSSSVFSTLANVLSFGIFSANSYNAKISKVFDGTSGVKSCYYYVYTCTSGTPALYDKNELETLENVVWKNYNEYALENLSYDENTIVIVYIKLIDNAGNVSYISTNGFVYDEFPSNISRNDVSKPVVKIVSSEKSEFYGKNNQQVELALSVSENETENGVYSGINTVAYKIDGYNLNGNVAVTREKTLFTADINPKEEHNEEGVPYSNLLKDYKSTISVDKELFNYNRVEVTVFATDNAGNINNLKYEFGIDITDPSVIVNGGVSLERSEYFSTDRTIDFTVVERNFDPDKVNFAIIRDGNAINISNLDWKKTSYDSNGNGDRTTYSSNITFSEEGEYDIILANCTVADASGNVANLTMSGDAMYIEHFVIDKTNPTYKIDFKNINGSGTEESNESGEIGYFSIDGRVGTLVITDKNFDDKRVTIDFLETSSTKSMPKIGAWRHDGERHITEIVFDGNGYYEMTVAASDLAGNIISPEFETKKFWIDADSPSIKVEGVFDRSAYANAEDIPGSIKITCDDLTVTEFKAELVHKYIDEKCEFCVETVEMYDGMDIEQSKNIGLDVSFYSNTDNVINPDSANAQTRGTINFNGIKQDGVYYLYVSAVDKAMNSFDKGGTLTRIDASGQTETVATDDLTDIDSKVLAVAFSVNHNGPSFDFEHGSDTLALNNTYMRSSDIINKNMQISVFNTDEVQNFNIQCTTASDGVIKKLTSTKEYTEIGKTIVDDESKSGYGWHKDVYSINPGLFVMYNEDGTLGETDETYMLNFIADESSTNIRFCVDDVKPIVVSAEINGSTLLEHHAVEKANSADIVITLSDSNLNEAYVEVDGERKEFEYKDSVISFTLNGSTTSRNIKVTANDYAGNEATFTYENLLISTNVFAQFYHNKLLFYGVVGIVVVGLCGVGALIIFKRKKTSI